MPVSPLSSPPGTRKSQRDLSVDELRGYALIAMIATHAAGSTVLYRLAHPTGPITAAALFIFMTGHVAGLKVARSLAEGKVRDLRVSFFQRGLKLWMIHVALFALFAGVQAMTGRIDVLTPLPSTPLRSALLALSLRWQPMYFDILPLYVMLLVSMPVFLEFLRRGRVALLVGCSALLWGLAQVYTAPGQSFALPAWQLVFVLGLASGVKRSWFLERWRGLVIGSGVVLVGTAVWSFLLSGSGQQLMFAKENMAPGRLVHCIAFLVLGRALLLELRRRELLIGARGVLSLLGRNSLLVFSAHLVLLLPLIALRVSDHSSMVQMLAMVGLTSLIAVFLRLKESRPAKPVAVSCGESIPMAQ